MAGGADFRCALGGDDGRARFKPTGRGMREARTPARLRYAKSLSAAERDDVSYSKFSKTLRIPEASVKRLVHQLRVRYRALLREEVGRTVEKPDEIDDELRYLSAALTAAE